MIERIGCISGCVLAGLFLWAGAAAAAEETVHMAFEKTVGADKAQVAHTVKKGDRLLSILRQRLGGTERENMARLDYVKRLNPDLKNVNIIYPGQRIAIPASLADAAAAKSGESREDAAAQNVGARGYVVRKGDTLYAVLRRELGIRRGDRMKFIDLMRQINPGISDVNRIFPGQKIVLPSLSEENEEVRDEKELKEPATIAPLPMPRDLVLPLLSSIAARVGATLITEGVVYIPVRPSGQVTLDAASIPLVEYKSDRKVLLDLDGKMPSNLKEIIESSWRNYSVVRLEGGGIPAVIEEVILGSGEYGVVKVHGLHSLAGGMVTVPVDWLVVRKSAASDTSQGVMFGIRFVENRGEVLPANITGFAGREGFDVMEIQAGVGIVQGSDNYGTATATMVPSSSKKALAAWLFERLGYPTERDVKIQLFSIEREGFNLSIVADIRTEIRGSTCIVVFDSLPPQFLDILGERKITVITIAEDHAKKDVILKVLGAAGIPAVSETISFPLGIGRDIRGGAVTLTGIPVRRDTGIWCFVEHPVDPALGGFLKKKWEVEILHY